MSVKIALAGNPNSGKTTLFNSLTGSNQYVGNWPGVTVEKKEGKLKDDKEVIIQDLPGIYSLSPYTLEEVVARTYLVTEKPNAILNIIDGTNIERNLYLTTQLIELGIPVVIAVNMMDLVRRRGDSINIAKLGNMIGCDVFEISALKNEGIKEAVSKAIGCGLINGSPLHFRDISLHHYPFGKPYILLTEKLVCLANSMTGIDSANIDFHVSISDDKNMVIASVIMTDER